MSDWIITAVVGIVALLFGAIGTALATRNKDGKGFNAIIGKFREVRTTAIIFALIAVGNIGALITILAVLLNNDDVINSIAQDTTTLVAVIAAVIAPVSAVLGALSMAAVKLVDDSAPPDPGVPTAHADKILDKIPDGK